MFKPRYKLTDKMVSWLAAIAESKAVIERAKILPANEIKLRRQALIRMSHSSTEIEGNRLNLSQVKAVAANKKIDAPARDVYEVENYLNALKYIDRWAREKQPLTARTLLKIHELVTYRTLPGEKSGHFRRGPVYVVRQRFGLNRETVYTGPDARYVPRLCYDLIDWLKQNQKENVNPVIAAGVAHQEIAAIHPFADGNGRTARAMATLMLYRRGYDFRRLFALEDYFNKDRAQYYAAINTGRSYEKKEIDLTSWLEYFIQGFKEEIDNVKAQVLSLASKKFNGHEAKVYLDKEQMKLLEFLDQVGKITVKDAVDITRRPKRTAQLKLNQLKKLGMIKQIGKGPASAYVLK